MVSKGQFMGLDWNRITRLHSHTLKQSVLLQHTYFCPQKNTQKGENKRTPFHVLPKHTLVCSLNTP